MKAHGEVPAFRTDRDAADYWAKHRSASYAKDLPAVAVKAVPALRRRVAARAKKPVTLRLEEGQIAAAKLTAGRMSISYQTLLRMWIAERLAKERAGSPRPLASWRTVKAPPPGYFVGLLPARIWSRLRCASRRPGFMATAWRRWPVGLDQIAKKPPGRFDPLAPGVGEGHMAGSLTLVRERVAHVLTRNPD